ncbi:hypothetical protein ASPSYDRAFT_26068 [Aspergillus sydowii CBS 593.65]|uniref:GPI-anchored cell surface glycoprotein n=1 Tax=Aspergillus sydowii CBS 593.65 TaxID=1036612 RepID=A0A1L9TX81_9EURO|nr:uncharacterized protein ASPSYDRAFT_26068 [Aspergillus sydowii CBS 593.65]OJJ64040.1 hypothetical protein ASPSYDRAFT_26068 [Aspergillus sydowii CBS 593.65]
MAVLPVVGRASVTRELGSPAALADLSSTRSRRSSSRASQRTAPAPELSTSNLTQSSYSLPPTPLTSSFEEILPSAKRRRTQRAVNSADQTPPSGAAQTPVHRAFSEPFRNPKSYSSSSKPPRPSNLARSNTQASQVQDASLTEPEPGTPTSSKSNPPPPAEELPTEQSRVDPQADIQTITPGNLPTREKSITIKAEPDKENSRDSPSAMGAAQSHHRKARKSMSTRSASQEDGTTPSKASSRASTPQSSRRDRKSRLGANTGAKITKASPASKPQSTPTANAKALENGSVNSTTPAKQQQTTTPTASSTRSRRGDRRSTRTANEQTPNNSNQGTVNSASSVAQNKSNEPTQSQSPSKRSNTVTLNVGRKSLESFLARQKANDDEIANHINTPGDIENGDYHFDYDSEMYKNNYGLDGHTEDPTSPTSLSTTTSAAARTSGRARKPTMRAMESLESESRNRRARAASNKPNSEATAGTTTRSKKKSARHSPTSASKAARKPDIMTIAKQIYELAAAAVAPGFVPASKADIWIKELQQKVDEKANEKETVTSPEPAQEPQTERENTPPSSKPFADNVQASAPWTDEDGWKYTGQVNKHKEEYVIVPEDYEWYRPNNTYGDDELPLPPVRVRSLVQAEKDRALGYPPRIGDRNTPVDNQGCFLFENIPEERRMLEIREVARARGIYVSSFMSFEEVDKMIKLYDSGQPPVLTPPPASLLPPAPENVPTKAKEPSRKRRRADTTSANKTTESVGTPKPKRRRQGANNTETPPATTPTQPTEEDKEKEKEKEKDKDKDKDKDSPSDEKKSFKITLTFENKRFLLEQASSDTDGTDTGQSDIEDNGPENARSHGMQFSTTEAPTTEDAVESAPSTPAKATDQADKPNTEVTPGSAEHPSTELTPGGRPRRRAADALMANFQKHAEDRAKRAERARLGHARRKGTPLKTVTGIHGDTVESPIRPSAVDPMNLD